MTFYVKRHDIPFDPEDSSNIVGEGSFNKFWPQLGWRYLLWLGKYGKPKHFEVAEIVDDKGNVHDFEKFVERINKLYVAK